MGVSSLGTHRGGRWWTASSSLRIAQPVPDRNGRAGRRPGRESQPWQGARGGKAVRSRKRHATATVRCATIRNVATGRTGGRTTGSFGGEARSGSSPRTSQDWNSPKRSWWKWAEAARCWTVNRGPAEGVCAERTAPAGNGFIGHKASSPCVSHTANSRVHPVCFRRMPTLGQNGRFSRMRPTAFPEIFGPRGRDDADDKGRGRSHSRVQPTCTDGLKPDPASGIRNPASRQRTPPPGRDCSRPAAPHRGYGPPCARMGLCLPCFPERFLDG